MLTSSIASSSMKGAIVPIGNITLTSPAVDLKFLNIPQVYQDLMLVCNSRSIYPIIKNAINIYFDTGASSAYWSATSLNSDGYSYWGGRGTTSGPVYGATAFNPGLYGPTGILGSSTFHILNYSNTSTFKNVIIRSSYDANGWYSETNLNVASWASTNAVTNINIGTGYGYNFIAGSTFSLYGIRSVNQ